MSRRIWVAVTVFVALLGLSACASGAQFSDLSREATADDAWPSSLPESTFENIDPASSRLVGHDGATALYLARSVDPSLSVCLLIYPDDGNWLSACGADGLSAGGGSNAMYTVNSDGQVPEGRHLISENVHKGR